MRKVILIALVILLVLFVYHVLSDRYTPYTSQARVETFAGTRYYIDEGKRAYRFVSEHERAGIRPQAQLFRRLSDQFEGYVGVLDYARKVYFRDPPDHPFFRLAFA